MCILNKKYVYDEFDNLTIFISNQTNHLYTYIIKQQNYIQLQLVVIIFIC